MALDVPQWLSQAYVRSMLAAGSPLSKDELAVACRELAERWASEDRRYHTLSHLADTLTRIESLESAMHEPELVRLAAWYHGAVFSVAESDIYTRNGGEDETASAALAEKELTRLGVDGEKAARVATLIRSLRRRESEASSRETAKFQAIDVDALALRDAHLGCLAVEPQRYRTYVALIREEYAGVPDISFCRARRAIVHNLLRRRPLFITPLAREWEESARDNLEAEEERIAGRLAEMEALAPVNPRMPLPRQGDDSLAHFASHPEQPPAPVPPFPLTDTPTEQMSAVTATSAPVAATADRPAAPSPSTAATPARTPGVKTPSRAKVTADNLRRYSAEEDAAEAADREREYARRAAVAAEGGRQGRRADTYSSLEAISDRVEGARERSREALSPEARKRQKREEIAAEMRRRISERQRTGEQARVREGASTGELRAQGVRNTGSIPRVEADIASPVHERAQAGAVAVAPTASSPAESPSPSSAPSAPSAPSGTSAPSASSAPSAASPGSGMEREPKD